MANEVFILKSCCYLLISIQYFIQHDVEKSQVPSKFTKKMYHRVDATVHIISLKKFVDNKKYKEQILNEIISAICAMLNTNGGNVELVIEPENGFHAEGLPFSRKSSVIRILEQSLISIIGLNQTVSKINFREGEKNIILVHTSESLITTNYNLYLPSESQVVQVYPWETQNTDNIIRRRIVEDPVQHGSHCKLFLKGKHCGFHESKLAMCKNLKAEQSKRTRIADRMTGKGNKFSCYVSAFANYKGGHMYYGIKDDGIVEGEEISHDDISGITKKVEKAINKMIWPEEIGQPKQKEHWDIFFESVLDKNSNYIPSTFVVVIYIAPCQGGVFTEQPECYEMVEGIVQKMSLATWKEKQFPTYVPTTVKRLTWSSTTIQHTCTFVDQMLTQAINNGKPIHLIASSLTELFPKATVEVQLMILSKKVMISYRSGGTTTEKLLQEYEDLIRKTPEAGIFDAIGAYIQTAAYRATKNLEALKKALPGALNKAENIQDNLISAAIYLLVATVKYLLKNTDDQDDDKGKIPGLRNLLHRALEHLQHVNDSPIVRADMEQKSHITLALYNLGCTISGEFTKNDIDSESLEKAKSSIMAVKISIDDGNPMNRYREIQFNLVQSVLFYRCFQHETNKKQYLTEAFNFSRKAEYLARKHKFLELLNWAGACMTFYTECLLRRHSKSTVTVIPKSKSNVDSPQAISINPNIACNDNL